jgi:hypothetical protein
MKAPLFQCLSALAICCAFLAQPLFSQTTNIGDHARAPPNAAVALSRPVAPTRLQAAADCDNDLVAPEIQCPVGFFNPDARAAYVNFYPEEPWGYPHNFEAMNAVFSEWDALYYPVDAATLLSPAYNVIFLEGSYYGGAGLGNFLTDNAAALENWVANGGALLIGCAALDGISQINVGFGGVVFYDYNQGYEGYNGIVQVPTHPIFNGPFTPANGNFTGGQFYLGTFAGDLGTVLIRENNVCLSEKTWGAGKVYFSTITPPYYTQPQPNTQNLLQNILADLSVVSTGNVSLSADAGQCFATVADASLDATATDDCTLASLTHDFAAAPSNTTLSGAALPVGITKIIWTATDAAGNTSTCEMATLVREPEAPTITCPLDISVQADIGTCSAVVDFSATATDNCGSVQTVNYAPTPSGGTFYFGQTTVVATATDVSGNQSNCAFLIYVLPNPETCNGIDDDCDGWVDEDVADQNTFYRDADFDGYGTPTVTTTGIGCYPPYGYSANALDCDDTNYYIRPGGYEYCNGIDDNCDGQVDEGVAPTWYADADGDGYGNAAVTIVNCAQPQGYVANGADCDDSEPYIYPGAFEDCTNTTDDNCDGILGENNFSIEETHQDVFCGSTPDGKISISMTPAQNYPLVRWSTGALNVTTLENLNAGTYRVTVTNECGTTKTKSIVVQPSATPALQVSMSGTAQICGGSAAGSILATPADGCGNYTYQWASGSTDASLSGLSGGTYEVVVTDACGCTQIGRFTINEPNQLGIYVNVAIPLLDGTYFVQVIPYGGTALYQFRRSDLAGGFTAWSASNGFIGVPAGDNTFETQDANGCTAQAALMLAPISLRPQAENATETTAQRTPETAQATAERWSVPLFPNPNTGNFNVILPENTSRAGALYVSDVAGRIVHTQKIADSDATQAVQAGELPSGLYFLQVVVAGKVMAVEQFVKE